MFALKWTWGVALLLCATTACEPTSDADLPQRDVRSTSQELVGGYRWLNGKRAIVKWGAARRHNLTYCISEAYSPGDITRIRQAMLTAAARWEKEADVKFVEAPRTQKLCDPYQAAILDPSNEQGLSDAFFSVIPRPSLGDTAEGEEFAARAFYPSAGGARLLKISDAWWDANPSTSEVAGLLTHELGHVLGFLHEHTRLGCLETLTAKQIEALGLDGTTALTVYDQDSVMHYGEKCGRIDPDTPRSLSNLDKLAVACVYGRAGSGALPSWCNGEELWDVPGPEYKEWSGTWTHTIYGPLTP